MLKRKLPLLVGGFLAVLVIVGAIGAGVAHADDSTPPFLTGEGRGPRGGRGLGQAELEAAAQVLDMTADELSAALKDGKTLEELSTAAGVDIADVQSAIQAAHKEEMRAQIAQAVEDGTMTQDKADWLIEGLDKGYLDGGPGFGRGGHHGFGGMGEPPASQSTPTTTP